MKKIKLIIFLFLTFACSKEKPVILEVRTLDQINGTWRWESTCGGITGACGYSSKSNYGWISFSKDGQLIESFRDTIRLRASYTIIKNGETNGMLIMTNIISDYLPVDHIEDNISLSSNTLLIGNVSFIKSYSKIK